MVLRRTFMHENQCDSDCIYSPKLNCSFPSKPNTTQHKTYNAFATKKTPQVYIGDFKVFMYMCACVCIKQTCSDYIIHLSDNLLPIKTNCFNLDAIEEICRYLNIAPATLHQFFF